MAGQDAEAGHQIAATKHSGADEQRLLAMAAAVTATTARPEGRRRDRMLDDGSGDLLVAAVVAQSPEAGHQEE